MTTPITHLSPDVAVAPQLGPQDMVQLAAAGFKSVIINRPDFEGGPEQPSAAEVTAAALALGLRCEYQPVVSGSISQDDVRRFADLLASLPRPVLAYCRSGTRCTLLYRAATAQTSQ